MAKDKELTSDNESKTTDNSPFTTPLRMPSDSNNSQIHVPNNDDSSQDLSTALEGMNLNEQIEWSADSGDEGLGKINGIVRGHFSYFGGNKESNFLYTPSSKTARPDTSSETKGQGDHLIPFAFLSHVIMESFKGNNIKTLDTAFDLMEKAILPDHQEEKKEEKDEVKEKREKFNHSKAALRKKFESYRESRKNSTGAIRKISTAIAAQTKEQLKESDRRHIREDIEGVASDLIELLNVAPEASLSKSRQEESKIKFSVAIGSNISGALNFLIDFNVFMEMKNNSITAKLLQSDSPSGNKWGNTLSQISPGSAQKYNNLRDKQNVELAGRLNSYSKNIELTPIIENHLVTLFSYLIDYPRTGVDGKDNEKILYNTIARLTVMIFSTFKGFAKFKAADKEKLYAGLIDKVLKAQGWIDGVNKDNTNTSTHIVEFNGQKQPITKEIVKAQIAKIALLDFEANKFQMSFQRPQNLQSAFDEVAGNEKSENMAVNILDGRTQLGVDIAKAPGLVLSEQEIQEELESYVQNMPSPVSDQPILPISANQDEPLQDSDNKTPSTSPSISSNTKFLATSLQACCHAGSLEM